MEKRYLVVYALRSRDHRDLPILQNKVLYEIAKEGENPEEKISKSIENIVNDPKQNNTSAQILGGAAIGGLEAWRKTALRYFLSTG